MKAFHVSCACEGKDNNIVFNVLRESEKEVVLLDAVSPPNHKQVDLETHAVNGHDAMAPNKDAPSPNVLKVIKKLEVQVLCSQHNPVRSRLFVPQIDIKCTFAGCCSCEESVEAR